MKAFSCGMAKEGLSEETTIGLRFEAHAELRKEHFSLRNQ